MALGKTKRKNVAASKSASKESVNSGGPPPAKKAKVPQPSLLTIAPRSETPGCVLTVGEGDTGQLGLGPDTMDCKRLKAVAALSADVIDVFAGGMHTLCLTKDGKLYSFGCNDESALGRSTEEEDSETEPGLVAGLTDRRVVQMTAGDSFSAALTDAGDVLVWGTYRDSSGAIGLVEPARVEAAPRLLPVGAPVAQLAAGSNHLALLDTDGQLYTAGNAEQGQLARVPELFSHRGGRRGLEMLLQPQRVSLGGRSRRVRFDRVWCGAFCTVVRDTAGRLFAAGLNNYSQLGLAGQLAWQLEPLASFAALRVAEFAGAMHHSVVRDEDGRVYTLGRRDDGRLGLPGLTEDVSTPTAVTKIADVRFRSVSAAGYVTMAVSEEGHVYGWGMGSTGQLGMGDDEDRTEPDRALGKQLEDKEALAVSVGGTHTVVLARQRQQNGH